LANPAERDRIERAVNQLNAELESRADTLGESRSAHRRVAFEPPCGVSFIVNHPDDLRGIVRVTHFWTF